MRKRLFSGADGRASRRNSPSCSAWLTACGIRTSPVDARGRGLFAGVHRH
jgi:hypothetical protein